MPLVSAKCTNCDADLEVDSTKDAAICPHCGTPYIVEKAINYYNTTNNITAEVVNVYGGNSADFVIRAGELKEYKGAATEVEIPNNVTIIGLGAFSECKGLISVSIPDSVTSIGWGAFSDCSSLKNIRFSDSVTYIDDRAFEDCRSLTNIILPNSLTHIGESAFWGCTSLKSISIPDSVTFIGKSAFSDCYSLESAVLPNNTTSLHALAFVRCKNLKSIHIPDGVTLCPDYDYSYNSWTPFYECDNLVIDASDEWKTKYSFCHPSLSAYRPQPQQQSSGCYIATAVYGSYDCPSVWTLRRYRDNKLAKSFLGRAFIRCYYAISPMIVRMFGNQKWFNRFWRKRLDRFVSRLQAAGYEDSPYTDRQF